MAWRSACLVPSLRRYQFILLGEQRHMCVCEQLAQNCRKMDLYICEHRISVKKGPQN